MNAFFLFVIMLGLIAQNVTKKAYNQKTSNGGTYVFTGLSTLAAALFFLHIIAFPFGIHRRILQKM